MKTKSLITSFILAVLVACTPLTTVTPTETIVPTPTSTYTPTPVPTLTITPSPIPLPENSFSAQIVGQGEHGAMVEIIYDDEWGNLDGISIEVNIKQDGKIKDALKNVEIIDGQHLAEMTDARYFLGSITIEIILRKNGNTQTIQRETEYKQAYPFIYPLFRQNDFPSYTLFVNDLHTNDDGTFWYAKDFCFAKGCNGNSSQYGQGTKIYMPFSFQILRLRAQADICQPVVNYNIWIHHPYTGYNCQLSHTQPGELLTTIAGNSPLNDYGWGFPPPENAIIPYDPNQVIAIWGPKDGCSGLPHLHIECQSPYLPSSYPDEGDIFFGYSQNLRRGFCNDGITPCASSRNIELSNLFLSDWITPDK